MSTTELTTELKGELNALVPSQDYSIEADLAEAITDISQITVSEDEIDTSEVDSQEDKDFLIEQGEGILLANKKADFAIAEITKRIKQRASLSVGPKILAIQERFGSLEGKGSTLYKFWHSVGFWNTKMAGLLNEKGEPLTQGNRTPLNVANRASQAYRVIRESRELFSEFTDVESNFVDLVADQTLTRMESLPEVLRQEIVAEVVTGEREAPKEKEIKELAAQPEVKLTKAQELLEKAKAKKAKAQQKYEEVKTDPNIPYQIDGKSNPEYKSAQNGAINSTKVVEKLEKEIKDLEVKVAAKAKEAEEATKREAAADKAKAAAEAELKKLQADDTNTRRLRVSQLSQALVSSVPDVTSDINKFFAEIAHYDMNAQESILESCKSLAAFLTEHLKKVDD